MGNQKLKWTAEEEQALIAGIAKHTAGRWKNILRDPEFSDQLINRSNIDLKDKWRNMCVPLATQSSNNKARPATRVKDEGFTLPAVTVAAATATTTPTPTPPPKANSSSSSPAASSLPRNAASELSTEESSNIVADTKNAPRYDGMIFEALYALAHADGSHPDGSDIASIYNFIEPRHQVPPNFRRILSSRLRRLAAQFKLLKSQNFYKIPEKMPEPSGTRTPGPKPKETNIPKPKETNIKPRQSNNHVPPVSQEEIETAAKTAAYKIVEAENKVDVAKVAVEEWGKMTKLADETELVLELAKELHEQCSHGEVVFLA